MSKVPLLTITKENDDWYDRKIIITNASLHKIKLIYSYIFDLPDTLNM
jgi:hypothetical protein